ncbi:MAG: hypothetical protein JWN34_3988, partial [Bryobacterales bacterium]|nr:hypothetical protein [Bryobacterales bacterium]
MQPLLQDSVDEPAGAQSTSFVDIVIRNKKIVALFALGCGLLGFIFTAPRTKVYRAHASIEFAGLNDNVLGTREVDPSAVTDNSSQAYINTQSRVLQSTPLLTRVATKVKEHNTNPSTERKKKA